MRAHAFISLLAAALLLQSTASLAQTSNLEKTSLNLAVGGRTLVAYLPLTIADQLGYFKKQGLDVEISDFAGGAKALQALVGGSSDVVCGAYEHTIMTQAKGVKLTAVALQNDSFGLVVGLTKKLASTYKGPKDLKGLKIGVTAPGSASAAGLGLLLAKAGLTLNDVSVIGVGGGPRAIAAMTTGQLDGMANFDPVISVLERDGAMVAVVDTRREEDLQKLYSGNYAASAFYMRETFIKANPRTTQAFVNAIHAALAWIDKATTDQIVDAVPADHHGGDKALYRTVVEKNRARFSKDGRISMAAAENVQRILAEANPEMKGAKIDLAATFDNSFVEKARAATSR
jgi:NitT/TauT family transport system substrate-binding protein